MNAPMLHFGVSHGHVIYIEAYRAGATCGRMRVTMTEEAKCP